MDNAFAVLETVSTTGLSCFIRLPKVYSHLFIKDLQLLSVPFPSAMHISAAIEDHLKLPRVTFSLSDKHIDNAQATITLNLDSFLVDLNVCYTATLIDRISQEVHATVSTNLVVH